jgi:RHS repeat-associated protein
VFKENDSVISTYNYLNKYCERVKDSTGNVFYHHYIYGDGGIVALHIGNLDLSIQEDTLGFDPGIDEPVILRNTDTTDVIYFIHTDHLGSYCALTDTKGNVVQRNCFDPWGNYAFESEYDCEWSTTNPQRGDTILGLSFPITRRGFTGHEHYPELKIINMNGRLYDPVIGRMFSPDKYVANSSFTQDFNRYSYARNNPLMYTDPDGEWIQFVLGAVIGGFSGYQIGKAAGATGFWEMAGYVISGAAIGTITAGIGSAITTAVGTGLTAAGASCAGWVGAMAGSAASGAISGAAFTSMAGGNPLDGMWKGALSGLAGSSLGPLIGGVPGAIVSGAMSGAASSALNGGSWKDVGTSALLGGAVSWGSYEISQAIGYASYKKAYNRLENKPHGGMWNYRQYRAISVVAQRSFARGVEGGGWIKNKKVDMWPYGTKDGIEPKMSSRPGAKGFFHTHPNKGEGWIPGHGTDDINFNNTDPYFKLPSYIIGRNDVYYHMPLTDNSQLLFSNTSFNPYPYHYYPFLYLNLW